MKIFYRNILILMFTVIMASPLKGHAPLACKVRDSRNCISPEIFERDLADGCASLDGNCRKVFCKKCVDSFDDDPDAQKSTKFRQLCGIQCTVPEALIRFNNPEDRIRLYALAEMALKERILKADPNHPIQSIDLLTDLFEQRLDSLRRYRENSLTYRTLKALYEPAELLMHGSRDRFEQTASDLRQNVQGTLERAVQQGIDRANQCSVGVTQRVNRMTQEVAQHVDQTAQKLNQRIKNLSDQVLDLGQRLEEATGKQAILLNQELNAKMQALKHLRSMRE